MSPPLAPAFSLPTHRGDTFSIPENLGPDPLLLTFFRGHWCPYCRRYLSKISEHYNRIRAAGARVIAISPEGPEISARLARELALPFLLLSDMDGDVIKAYGVRNSFSAARSLLPHPAVFIITPLGNIAFRSVDRNYKKRTTIRTILSELEKLSSSGGMPAAPFAASSLISPTP